MLRLPRGVGLAVALVAATAGPMGSAAAATPPATPKANCGPGSKPEPSIQGRVPAEEVASGRADQGYFCNIKQIGHIGESGGFKTHRFVDKAGHECAYYDTTLLFPLNAQNLGDGLTGVAVLDMSNPSKPVRTTTLATLAMQSPHESLNLSTKRGLLAAVYGNPGTGPGVVDVYDLNDDCRAPALQASLPVGFLGHESGFAPDGRTFYATSLFDGHVTAVDLDNPKVPVPLTVFESFSHGMNTSDDGNRAYIGARDVGLQIMDTSEIQARKPNPQVHEISTLTWDTMSIPQNAIPVTIAGKPYVVEVDEFSVGAGGGSFPGANGPRVGAARIIDIADEKKPKVVGDMRLAVHQPENRDQLAGDPGATSYVQGYAGHYCNVPQRKDPVIVACSFIASGLRVFDIRDPAKPKEIAYFVAPPKPSPVIGERSNYAMSSPEFVPARGEIWYTDGSSGFYALKVTNGVWPFGAGEVTACLRPAKIGFKLHRVEGTRVVRVEAFVNGKRKLKRTGSDIKRIELAGLKRAGKLDVRIVATHNTGAKVVSTRSWNGCKKGKPTVRVIPRP
jgi:LVIVD repeat-containing protein